MFPMQFDRTEKDWPANGEVDKAE